MTGNTQMFSAHAERIVGHSEVEAGLGPFVGAVFSMFRKFLLPDGRDGRRTASVHPTNTAQISSLARTYRYCLITLVWAARSSEPVLRCDH